MGFVVMGIRNKFFIYTLACLGLMACSAAVEKKNEKWYQQKWCGQMGGEMEVVLKDKTRCDCLVDGYAIEVDFSKKWAEAIGQSLHYAKMTNEEAGILLIIESPNDKRHLKRLEDTISYHSLPIRVWTTDEEVTQSGLNR